MIDFNKLIDNYLVKELKPKSIGRYYPSEVGGCLRKTWFSYKAPKETDTALTRIFQAGNMLHDFITDVLKSEKNEEIELLDSEIPIKIEQSDFVISGRIDNLVLVKINDEQYLIEVKSTRFLPEQAAEAHEMQLQLYMHATGIHQGIILYIQKDNLQTDWFNVKYNSETVNKILDRFQKLHESLITDKIPEAEARKNSEKKWMCKNCPYLEECKDYDSKLRF